MPPLRFVSDRLSDLCLAAALITGAAAILTTYRGFGPEWLLPVGVAVHYGAFAIRILVKIGDDSDRESFTPLEHIGYSTSLLGMFMFPLAVVAGPTKATIGAAGALITLGFVLSVALQYAETTDGEMDSHSVPDDPTDMLEDGGSE